jgi:hypothetical protein
VVLRGQPGNLGVVNIYSAGVVPQQASPSKTILMEFSMKKSVVEYNFAPSNIHK